MTDSKPDSDSTNKTAKCKMSRTVMTRTSRSRKNNTQHASAAIKAMA